jgi:hypothetical protein
MDLLLKKVSPLPVAPEKVKTETTSRSGKAVSRPRGTAARDPGVKARTDVPAYLLEQFAFRIPPGYWANTTFRDAQGRMKTKAIIDPWQRLLHDPSLPEDGDGRVLAMAMRAVRRIEKDPGLPWEALKGVPPSRDSKAWGPYWNCFFDLHAKADAARRRDQLAKLRTGKPAKRTKLAALRCFHRILEHERAPELPRYARDLLAWWVGLTDEPPDPSPEPTSAKRVSRRRTADCPACGTGPCPIARLIEKQPYISDPLITK